MTNRQYFEVMVTVVEGSEMENKAEILEFLKGEIEKIDKKSASNARRKAEKAEENNALADAIRELLSTVEYATPKEIGIEIGVSTQKATSILKNVLMANDEVVRVTEGKSIFYALKKDEDSETETE